MAYTSVFKRLFAPRNENSRRFKKEMAQKLDKRAIKYCAQREESGEEIIVGKNGMINLRDGELILLSGDRILFRGRIGEFTASELMSLEGVILEGPNLEEGGKRCKIVAYYTDFYKRVTKK